jgi:iron complex outermembrane receptor protein
MKFKLTALSASVLTAVLAPAFAQTPPPQKVEKIEVTGSNIKRVDAESSANIQVITKEEISKSGANTVAELLRAVPSIGAGALQDFNTGNGFSAGAQSASLRGLGSVGTLLLLNGHRLAPSPTADPNTGQGQAYNLNTIPLTAIERIEVLKDGASAIYGSDAIAGVINFILRKDYEGGEVSFTQGANISNRFKNYTVNGTVGIGNLARDRYNFLVTSEYFHRDAQGYNDVSGVDNDAYRVLASRNIPSSSISTVPNFYREGTLGNGAFTVGLPTDPRCPAANVVSATAGCRFNSFDYLQIQSKAERAGFLAKGTYDFSATLQGTAELAFTRATNWFTSVPPGFASNNGTGAIWFAADGTRNRFQLILPVGHPDNPYTVPVALNYRWADLGGQDERIFNDAARGFVGLKGTFGAWDWESGLLYSKTSRTDRFNGQLYLPALQAAVANRTYRFNGSTNDPAVIAALNPYKTNKGNADLTSLDFKGTRELMDLPGGALAIATGAEFRRESFDITSDPRLVKGDFVNIASTTVNASRTVSSAFAELSIPFIKNLETQLAARFDHYSDYGNSTTPKVGVKYKPHEWVAVRANYAEAFRAPSLTQASNSRVQSFSTVTDPVRCPNGTTPAPGGDSIDCTGRSVSSLFGSVANLEPERSKSWSYGLIVSPWSNLSFQADLFEIRRRNQIDRFSAQQVINNEFNPAFTGGSVQRDPNPATWLVGVPNSGPVVTTLRRFLNMGETRVKGIDYEASTNFRLGPGKVALRAQATWMIRYDYQVDKGGPFVNNAGNFYLFETPRLRGNVTAEYQQGDVSTFLRYNYTGGWDYNDPTVASGCYLSSTSLTLKYIGRCQVRAWSTIDIGGAYRGLKNWTFSGVIRNVEDKRAPFDPNQTTLGFNPTFHNPYGAMISLTAAYRFK